MENLNNQLVGEILVDEVEIMTEGIVENNEIEIEEVESNLGKTIAVGATLALAAVTGGVFLIKKLKANKKAKIEFEATNQIIETLRKAGKTDEEIESYLNVSKELHEVNSEETIEE